MITVAGLCLVAEAGVVVGATTASLGAAGFAAAVAAGAVLVFAALGRRSVVEGPPLEGVGILGLVVGVGLAGGSESWLAAALTAAAVALGCAAWRRERAGFAGWSGAVAVAAVWAWLVAANVSVLEAYTLPAAAMLLGVGIRRRRQQPEAGSWAAYGPGLVLALGPSLLVALDHGGTVRPFAVIAGGIACVLVGRQRRLQAPLILGALALIALAIEDLGPVAARVPRWAMLGAVGLVMLWLGASAERRLNQLRRWRESLDQLA